MKKLFNFNEYHKLNEEADLSVEQTKLVGLYMLDVFFSNVDVEKLLVNGAQIISIITSFFGKFGMRISLTIEGLLFLYWIWKYNDVKDPEKKQDALIQLIFSSFGFVTLGAVPAFKAVSKSFATGYKEYKLTGEVAMGAKELKILSGHEAALQKAANGMDKTIADNIEKLPHELVSNATKNEIKEASKGVKQYLDELLTGKKAAKAEAKAVKEIEAVEKEGKLGKVKKTKKIVKLARKAFPIASYLLSRFLNKKKKPEHLEEGFNDLVVVRYSTDQKIVGCNFPNDAKRSVNVREDRNGKVMPCVIGLKMLIEDFDGRKIIKGYNMLTDLDSEYEYYIACNVNGEPILDCFKIFAIKGKKILGTKLVGKNIQFENPLEIDRNVKSASVMEVEAADDITKNGYKNVFDVYIASADKVNNSFAMWSKIIDKTFGIEWWIKNFKPKESK